MKSSKETLRKRGYVDKDLIQYNEFIQFNHMDKDKLIEVAFDDNEPFRRTFAIRVLRNKFDYMNIPYCNNLLKALSIEKALYTRLEICDSLQRGDSDIAQVMCDYIGKIGSNVHNVVPDVSKVSKKKSFPLPRDIIARTLGKMDMSIIEVLYKKLNENCGDGSLKYELLDAIGFMTFYNKKLDTEDNLNKIINLYKQYKSDKHMTWKIAMCCSAFASKKCNEFLNTIKLDVINAESGNENENVTIIAEADRSIRIINERMNN